MFARRLAFCLIVSEMQSPLFETFHLLYMQWFFTKPFLRNLLFGSIKKGFLPNLSYETFCLRVREEFFTKPFVRNPCFDFPVNEFYETLSTKPFYTEPSKVLPVCPGEEPFKVR